MDLEQRGAVKGTGSQRPFGRRAAADDHRCALTDGVLDDLVDAVHVGLVDDRAHLAGGIGRGPDPHCAQPGSKLGADLIGDAVVHEKPAAGRAELPGEHNQRADDDRKRELEVGVRKEDQRCLATQFQSDAFEVRRYR